MKKVLFTAAIALGAFVFAPAAQATIVSYNLNFEFSGGDAPVGPAPWMTVSFDDGGGTGSVLLTINTDGLTPDEIAEDVYLNFDPNLDPTDLVFAAVGVPTATPNSILLGVDAFKADGDGFFDILIDYPPPPGQTSAILGADETVQYTITATGIDANSFDFFSAPGGGTGQYHAAAHIQRIDVNGEPTGSGWIGDTNGEPPPPPDVPEPMTMLLFGTGLVGLAGARRKMRNQ